jgi:hypothetical protein
MRAIIGGNADIDLAILMQIFNDDTMKKSSYKKSNCTNFDKQMTFFNCIEKLPEGPKKNFVVLQLLNAIEEGHLLFKIRASTFFV